jgi:hypothetical protein
MSAQLRIIMKIRLEINFYREIMTGIKKNKDEIHPCFPNLTKLISMKKLCFKISDTKIVHNKVNTSESKLKKVNS